MSTIPRRIRTVTTAGALVLLAASVSAAARDPLSVARAATLLEEAGASELALELVSLETGLPVSDLRSLDRSAAETARAAVLTALTSIDLPLAHALLTGGDLSVREVAVRVGRSESEVRDELGATALALEAGAVALGLLDVKHMHGPGGPGLPGDPDGDDGTTEPCEPGEGPGPGGGPGHGPHHGDCEPGDPDGPGPGPGPGDDHHGPHEYEGEDCDHPETGLGPHGHGCPVEFAEEFTVDPFQCTPSDLVACSTDERFEVTVEWGDFDEELGVGHTVDLPSPASSLFWFFDDQNYELLVKTLDGCAINGHFWVFAAATTNVEYALTVIDSETGQGKTYFSPLHLRSRAIADAQAFPCP